ncbi:conjugative transposon protein TraM [Chryseobacterium sp. TY3]
MEKLKEIWKTQSEDQRRKIIAYSIVGVIGCGMFYGVYLIKGKDKTQKVEALSNPDAKAGKKYNSRLEANQMDKKDTANINMAIDEIFGTSKPDSKVEEKNEISNETYYEPDYSQSYQQSQNTNQNYIGGGSSYSQPVNHYPDYRNNDSEFYEELKNNVRISKTKKKTVNPENDMYQNSIKELNEYTSTDPTYKPITQQEKKTIQIKARLLSQGYVNTGKSISFVLLEKAVLQGHTVNKGQILTGIAQEQNNRLLVKFSTIKVNEKIIPVEMHLYGSDGMEGLPISATEQNQSNRASSIISNTLGNIPIVGGIANDAIKSNSNDRRSNIKLTPNISCTILYKT